MLSNNLMTKWNNLSFTQHKGPSESSGLQIQRKDKQGTHVTCVLLSPPSGNESNYKSTGAECAYGWARLRLVFSYKNTETFLHQRYTKGDPFLSVDHFLFLTVAKCFHWTFLSGASETFALLPQTPDWKTLVNREIQRDLPGLISVVCTQLARAWMQRTFIYM